MGGDSLTFIVFLSTNSLLLWRWSGYIHSEANLSARKYPRCFLPMFSSYFLKYKLICITFLCFVFCALRLAHSKWNDDMVQHEAREYRRDDRTLLSSRESLSVFGSSLDGERNSQAIHWECICKHAKFVWVRELLLCFLRDHTLIIDQITGIVRGVEFLHEKDYVHRDIRAVSTTVCI